MTRAFRYETSFTLWQRTVDPSSPTVNMAHQNPSFKTIQSTPHLNLSAHTFIIYTLPFHRISSVLGFLASDEAATNDLLILDRINQTIVNLE